MKYLSFLFTLLLILPSCSQQKHQVEEPAFVPTHILELMVEGMEEPVKAEVQLSDKGTKHFITIIMPDEEKIETEYVVTEENEFRFMMADVKMDNLLTIHYNGVKNQDGNFEGKFAAMVNGIFREDMSGDFAITAK
ncbi:MAG: hypothetical protein GY855_07810 [candidate division Zixibacteria bacterium]|nr:hypothetical protein [candidate division Zixibacteria bacterium]